MTQLSVGELARHTSVSVHTVRYYDQRGLLTVSGRTAAGHRRFHQRAVEELRLIRRAQSLGFPLEEVRQALDLVRTGATPCSPVLELGRGGLERLDRKIRELRAARARLQYAMDACGDEPCRLGVSDLLCIGPPPFETPLGTHA